MATPAGRRPSGHNEVAIRFENESVITKYGSYGVGLFPFDGKAFDYGIFRLKRHILQQLGELFVLVGFR